MGKTRILLCVAISSLVLAPGAYAAKSGKKTGGGGASTSDVPVVVTFRDCNGGVPSPDFLDPFGNGCPVTEDRVKSDGGGPYWDGQPGVSAVIQGSNGQLRLDLSSDDLRGLFMDFNECASGATTCHPPLETTGVDNWARLTMGGQLSPNGLLGMTVDPSVSVAVAMRITIWDGVKNGNAWIVYFDPNADGGTRNPCTGQGQRANVTRTTSTQWVVTFDSGENACVSTTNGPKNSFGFEGTYHLPMELVIDEQ